MIGKISARGANVAGLLYYLYGPGRNETHADPHLVAGWRDPVELEPALGSGGRRDFRRLTGLLEQPHAALGPSGAPGAPARSPGTPSPSRPTPPGPVGRSGTAAESWPRT